jgi:NDP-mannose synthase
MEAIILAGGKGSRLRPYTDILPKPLMPINGYPVLGIILKQLRAAGISKVIIAVNYMDDVIKAVFGNGEKYGIQIRYSKESFPLGTVGPLKLIRNLPENFLVMNCDILTDVDFRQLYERHVDGGNLLTATTVEKEFPFEFGVFEMDSNSHNVLEFVEKPIYKFQISVGVYVFNRAVLEHIPTGCPYGMDDLLVKLIKEGHKVQGFTHKGSWIDIGRPADLFLADSSFQDPSLENAIEPPHLGVN